MQIKMSDVKVLEIFHALDLTAQGDHVDYGIKMINAQKEWVETKGQGINVAVLDTGIDFTHPDLKDRVKGGINFTSSNPNDYMDRQGHGTHCAGVIGASLNNLGVVGVAPEVNIYAVKILGDDGAGDVMWIVKALDWCVQNNIHVVSMSLGSQASCEEVHNAVKRAYDKGIIMIAAAGNDGNGQGDTVDYPGRYPEVIAVAAVDTRDNLGSFSSTGPAVEVSAAGVEVISTFPGGKYAKLSGTSMACPHISGAVALLLAKGLTRYGRLLTHDEIKVMLEMWSLDMGNKGKDEKFGFGIFSF